MSIADKAQAHALLIDGQDVPSAATRTVFDPATATTVPPHVLRQAAVAAPVVGHGSPTVRDDEGQRRKFHEQVSQHELHEDAGVGVEVVRAERVEVWIA